MPKCSSCSCPITPGMPPPRIGWRSLHAMLAAYLQIYGQQRPFAQRQLAAWIMPAAAARLAQRLNPTVQHSTQVALENGRPLPTYLSL